MPRKLCIISGKEVVKILEKYGFVVVRSKGSHARLSREVADKETIRSVPVIVPPVVPDDIPESDALVLGPKYPTAGVIPFESCNLITAAFVKGPK